MGSLKNGKSAKGNLISAFKCTTLSLSNEEDNDLALSKKERLDTFAPPA